MKSHQMMPGVPYLVNFNNKLPTPITKLGQKQKDYYISICRTLSEFDYFRKRMYEIGLNSKVFEKAVNKYLEEHKKRSPGDGIEISHQRHIYIDINRCFINYITSIKSFIEHCEVRLKKQHGERTNEFKAFQKFLNNIYDGHLCYRLFIRLRDYAVHVYYPVDKIFFDSEQINGNQENLKHEFKPQFSKAKLLENDTIRKKLGNDIIRYGDFFDVQPFIDEMKPLLDNIFVFFLRSMSDHFLPIAKEIVELANQMGTNKIGLSTLILENEELGRFDNLTFPVDLGEELIKKIVI